MSEPSSSESEPPVGAGLFCLAFGIFLLYAGYRSWSDDNWPWFMPMQLDIIGFVTSFIPSPLGAHIAAVIVAGLGGLCALCGFVVAFLPDRKFVYPSKGDLERHRSRQDPAGQEGVGGDDAQSKA